MMMVIHSCRCWCQSEALTRDPAAARVSSVRPIPLRGMRSPDNLCCRRRVGVRGARGGDGEHTGGRRQHTPPGGFPLFVGS